MMENYTSDINGIYTVKNSGNFSYSDGDEIEKYILNAMQTVDDLSTGSEELYSYIKDWPTLYHLSPRRADILRPFASELKGKTILEIGSGCGALTRFLAEQGAEIVAIEGSYQRAQITSARCRDLKNVKVVCDNFGDFKIDQRFDLVIMVGVLEYSNIFVEGENPSLRVLGKAKNLLSKGGRLIVAIENKLGLKYWAGAPEDHLGTKYAGIEGRYGENTVITFGKKELTDLITASGFFGIECLYPFPDYKLPEVILTDEAFLTPNFAIESLLFEKQEYYQDRVYATNFSTTLAARELQKNHLLSEFSNSFLFTAVNGISKDNPDRPLALTYSSVRKRIFCKENRFIKTGNDKIEVERNYYYSSESMSASEEVKNVLFNEDYKDGSLLIEEIYNIVSTDNWSIELVTSWASRYYDVLKQYAIRENDKLWLPGKYLDLTPFNIIIGKQGETHVFDQEWVVDKKIPIYYVFFRGLFYSLMKIRFFNSADNTDIQSILELATSIVNNFEPFSKGELTDSIEREKNFLAKVNLGFSNPFQDVFVNYRLTEEHDANIVLLNEQLTQLQATLNKQISIIQSEQNKNLILTSRTKTLKQENKAQQKKIDASLTELANKTENINQLSKELITTAKDKKLIQLQKQTLAEQNSQLKVELKKSWLDQENNSEVLQQLSFENLQLKNSLREQEEISKAAENKMNILKAAVESLKEQVQRKDYEIKTLDRGELYNFVSQPDWQHQQTSEPTQLENIEASQSEFIIDKLQKQNTSLMQKPPLRLKKIAKYIYWTATFQLTKRRKEAAELLQTEEDILLIKKSGLFDIAWYFEQYPDVQQAGTDPVRHFVFHGYKEGRNPNQYFDTKWYLMQNRDVAEGGWNPLVHYIRHGAAEKRRPHPNNVLSGLLEKASIKNFDTNPLSQALWQFIKVNNTEKAAVATPVYHNKPSNFEKKEITILPGSSADDYKIHNKKFAAYRVIYVSGFPYSPSHNYRVRDHLMALNDCGIRSGWVDASHVEKFVHALTFAEVIVLFRVAITDNLEAIIKACKKAGVLIVYDTDDYVFDSTIAVEKYVDGLRFLGENDRKNYDSTVVRYKQALLLSDAGIFSTDELANAAGRLGVTSSVIRNGYSDVIFKASSVALLANKPVSRQRFINIGYGSGTLTHQRDFKMVSSVIARILKEFPNTRLVIIGMLDLEEFPEMKDLSDQIEMRPLVPHEDLPYELVNFDINLAPLEMGNPFCEAKSELKYFEASLVKVPTIASATAPYQRAIHDGENGLLARNEEDWYRSLLLLIKDEKLRKEMGERAYAHSIASYGKDAKRNEVLAVFNKLFRTHRAKLAKTPSENRNQTITIMTCGMDKGSGGHAIIIDMAKWLASWGHTITLAFSNASADYHTGEQIEREFNFDTSRMRAVIDADIPSDTNVVFATFWTTVYAIEKSKKTYGRRYYMMLDYEPYFYPMSTEYILSLNTYYKDFRRVSWGPWIKNLIAKRHEIGNTRTFPYYFNKNIYNSRTTSKRSNTKIVFFGRPNMPRRCFDLGLQVLQRYRELYGDKIEIIFFGSLTLNHVHIPFKHTQLGVLKPTELADLYRTATVGVAFSPTNPSKAPYEMMACGLPVLDLDIEGNDANYGNRDNVFLVHPDPDEMAHALNNIIINATERNRRAANGQRFVSEFPDESEAARTLFEILEGDAKKDIVNKENKPVNV